MHSDRADCVNEFLSSHVLNTTYDPIKVDFEDLGYDCELQWCLTMVFKVYLVTNSA